MSEEELRKLIETNFRLLSLSMREVAGRTGETGQELGHVKQELGGVQQQLGHVQQKLGHVQELAESNHSSLVEMADRLDQTLEALKALAFSDVESKTRLKELESQMESVLARLAKLEPAS